MSTARQPSPQAKRSVRAIDSTPEFERLILQPPSEPEVYVLKLYVAGTSARSAEAIAVVQRLCQSQLAGRSELEIVDIYQQPVAAADHQIIAAPTLVKQLPEPVRRLIGDMSDVDRVLRALRIRKTETATDAPTP